VTFSGPTIYHDITAYHAAAAAGKSAIINCAFGSLLVLLEPIYFSTSPGNEADRHSAGMIKKP
jgi:hypothetical protein